MTGKWALKAVKIVTVVAIASVAIGSLVMVLWNALIPELFHGPEITFWQGVGLLVLSHILFRGAGHSGRAWHHDKWSRRAEEKYASMTPEEREKFRNGLHRYCGCGPRETEIKP